MLARILDWSLRHRAVVVLAWTAVAIAGVISWLRLPVDAFPDTTPTQVQVNTVAPSLAPLEIERQISIPVEASIGGLPGLVEVRSVSKFGFSQVTATFEEGTDVYLARQTLSERLQGVELPRGVDRPTLGPVATGLGEVFHYLVAGDASLAELRTTHEWIVRPQMMAVPGVAEVNTWGGDARQFHVLVDPTALQRYSLSLADLAEAIEANSTNVGGGTLDRGGESTLVHGVGFAEDLGDIEAMVIAARERVPIRVRDVARVVEGRQIRRGRLRRERGRGAGGVLGRPLQRARRLEGAPPGQHLVDHEPEAVDITPRVDLATRELLGAHVLGGPDHGALERQRGTGPERPLFDRPLGDAEVADIHEVRLAAARGQQHVVGFEVAVDHLPLVRLDLLPRLLRTVPVVLQ